MTQPMLDQATKIFTAADTELLGDSVKQLMAANSELTFIHAVTLVGATLILSQHATDSGATSVTSDISSEANGDWRIELTKVEGFQ